MVNQVVAACDTDLWEQGPTTAAAVISGERSAVARAITAAETGHLDDDLRAELQHAAAARHTPVLGITGTGGSGKSSLTDELVRRLRVDQQDKLRIACIAIDPTRRRGGGALLGDRIRMNSLDGDRVYFRSLATRGSREVPEALGDVLTILKAAGFDLVVVETPGIGQGDAAITTFADVNLYVMTPEFGAASQLEKIDMLDFADVVAINKFERRGAHGRPARRRPPDGAQPRRLRQEARGHAGVRHLGRHLQRRRRHRPLPGAARPARRAGPRGRRGRARPGRRAALVGAAPGRAAPAGALPRRDRRDGARLPRRHPPVRRRRPPRAAAHRGR